MKVLVYGAGVIGGQIVHTLCACGHDVTVVARGAWAETLRKNGLRIRHYIQQKNTTDFPHVMERYDGTEYVAVLAVMQYRQMDALLPALAAVNSPLVILIGNNLSATEMERSILEQTGTSKTVLFGFGSTAGQRKDGIITSVHTGDGILTVGGLHAEAPFEAKKEIARLFSGSKCSINYCDNMDAWLKYHAAFILPVVYLCYATGCDLRRATNAQRRLLLDGAEDAYGLLMAMGYPVRPAGDERNFHGAMRFVMEGVIYLTAKTRLGALCTTEHCKNAPQEMEDLDAAFLALRGKAPDYPMPHFDRLRAMMSWERVQETYGSAG